MLVCMESDKMSRVRPYAIVILIFLSCTILMFWYGLPSPDQDANNQRSEVGKESEMTLHVQNLKRQLSETQQNCTTQQLSLLTTPQITTTKSWQNFRGMRIVHFDLKGAPPKIAYLIQVMELAAKHGAKGFLLEYEDMFPWSGNLSMLATKHAYSRDDIKLLVDKAGSLGVQLIPFIPTFGHMEFVLKHQEFKHLRAVKRSTANICPLNEGSAILVKAMIDQVVAAHPGISWLHLGGDEVWNIKKCERCRNQTHTDTELYQEHMIPILQYATSSKLSPIIWDDMLRSWPAADLKNIGQYATPMVWCYEQDVVNYDHFPINMWEKYMEVFPRIFFASAFKGATKPWSDFVFIKQRLDNNLSWLKIYHRFLKKGKTVVEGIALTGWSRFDHYAPLCELLPAAIPSMVFCLAALRYGRFDSSIHYETSMDLGNESKFRIDVKNFARYEPKYDTGTFPGGEVLPLLGEFEKAVDLTRNWADIRLNAWLRPYNVKRKHLSYFKLENMIQDARTCLKIVERVEKSARSILGKFFFDDTVEEWMQDKLYHVQRQAIKTMEMVQKVMSEHFDSDGNIKSDLN
ncbi:hexosaminidase D-like [Clytia hemisphaerica]|uniref:beta-N-acetylhexosaminidase n=1 Tax=Clytia hemisphaerica TaxID=252671 RepID=A0A7M5WJI0_9CNID